MTNQIAISNKNYIKYTKIKVVMDSLVSLDINSTDNGTSYILFAKDVNDRMGLLKSEANKLSFREFIADIQTNDTILYIDYKEYENLITANCCTKAILILDKKSTGKMDWYQYGIAVESIIKSYYKY